MLQLIPNNYLTIKSRKFQNLITKRKNIDFWLLLLVVQIYNNSKHHHTRLQVRSESLDSRQNLLIEPTVQAYESVTSNTKRDFSDRSSNTKQLPSSKPASSSTKFLKANPFHCHTHIFQWKEDGLTLWNSGEN